MSYEILLLITSIIEAVIIIYLMFRVSCKEVEVMDLQEEVQYKMKVIS